MQSKEKAEIRQLPMMPIRDVVIFPHMMTPFVVGRESSVGALEEALSADKKIFLATQHDASIDDPSPDQIYQVGTIVSIIQSLKLPDGNIKVLVEGVERARLSSVAQEDGFYRATVKVYPVRPVSSEKTETLISRVTSSFEQYVKQSQNLNYETMIAAVRVDDPGKLADTVGANLQLTIPEKQDLLEIFGGLVDQLQELRAAVVDHWVGHSLCDVLGHRCRAWSSEVLPADCHGPSSHLHVSLPAECFIARGFIARGFHPPGFYSLENRIQLRIIASRATGRIIPAPASAIYVYHYRRNLYPKGGRGSPRAKLPNQRQHRPPSPTIASDHDDGVESGTPRKQDVTAAPAVL